VDGGNRNDTFHLTVDEVRDFVFGRDGIDTVDYSEADRGLTIDLYNGLTTAKFSHDGRPVPGEEDKVVTHLSNVENVVGTRHDDVIIGSDGDNVLEGGAGADWINGADGRDTVSYAESRAGVRINLSGQDIEGVGRGFGGDAQGDRLLSIENVIGSDYNDWMLGTRGNNVFTGGAGNDTFVFNRTMGHDTITDFDATGSNHDILQLHGAFANFDELLAHAETRGHDVVIRIDDHNSITLQGVRLSNLDAGDFVFA
jgi:Ca2+-binding RTX toxin-like protein